MIERFSKILQTKTFSQSILTISATILSGLLGVLFFILVARLLGPAAFGLFSIAVVTLTAVADIGDLGTSTGLIRFVGRALPQNPAAALKFLKLGLEIKLLVWIVVLILGWFLSPVISEYILHKNELTNPLRLGFLGVGGALFFSFSAHTLQAYQKYRIWSLFIVGSNLLRLVVVLFIALTITLNIGNTLIVYITVPFIFFVISLLFLPKFFTIKNELSIANEFFKFNIWIFLLTIIAAFSARLDIFLVTRMLTIDQVGVYSVAVQLTSLIPQLYSAIATVAAPKLSSFHSRDITIQYLKKLQLFIIGIVLAGLTGIPIAYFLINHFFSLAYSASFIPFIILYIAQLIFLLALPTHQAIFYYFGKSQVFVPVGIGQLLIIFISGLLLINTYGVLGAAFSILLSNLFLLFAPALWVVYKFKK